MTHDWKYQVLHKSNVDREASNEDSLRLEVERSKLNSDLAVMKINEQLKLQQNIESRLNEEIHQRKLKLEEKLKVQKRHIEENEESNRIKREIEEEKEIVQNEMEIKKNTYKVNLLKQINSNFDTRTKLLNERKEKEKIERERLENICKAEQIEIKYMKGSKQKLNDNFISASEYIRNIQKSDSKRDNFSFLDDGWKMEKDKIQETNNTSEHRKQINLDCAEFNLAKLAEIQKINAKDQDIKGTELKDRLMWEAQLKSDLDQTKIDVKKKQDSYFSDISKQVQQTKNYQDLNQKYQEKQLQNLRNYQKHLISVDLRETQIPIDHRNPFLGI